MSALGVLRTRAGVWHCSFPPISTAILSTRTDDARIHHLRIPTPMLRLAFGGRSDGTLTVTSALAVERPAPPIFAPLKGISPVVVIPEPPEHPHRIELSIDSLPHHLLIEPIPVAIDPVGDAAYTAWVRNLDTNATGHSVVEALLLLKERIEFVYEDLNGRGHLSNEQKTTLQMLHTYIAPKKPEWV